MADKDSQKENKLPARSKSADVKKKDGYENVESVGSLEIKRVDQEADDFTAKQDQALLQYRVTGVVGEFCDPLRDQEPDIAPEYGVAPHPELYNPAPPKSSVGAYASRTRLTDPYEDKVKADDPSVAQGLSADTGTASGR